MKEMSQYHRGVSYSQVIDCDVPIVWNLISSESNLELFHPFCKNNRVIKWSNENSIDEIEYLNGLTLRRKFSNWIDQVGYDLYINQKGKPSSYVSWRLKSMEPGCNITITIYPYLFNGGNKLLNAFPFYFIIKPLLKTYLRSVVDGMKWHMEKGIPTPKNHFGKHKWFS